MSATSDVGRRRPLRLLRWAPAGVIGALAVYLAVINGAYWLWVATSAFLAIRDDRDTLLGAESVVLAAAPFGAAWVVLRSARRRTSSAAAWTWTTLAMTATAFLCLIWAVLISGPF